MADKKRKVNKVVLAYSGGLDTSVIVPWLKENYQCEVICFTGDLGQGQELEGLEEKALKSGASKLIVRDLRQEFVEKFVYPTIQAGAIYEHKYLLGTSFARPILARHQVEVAEEEGADAVSHGCTGKGNDQVRFEITYTAFNPELTIISPWREWSIRSREDAINYAKSHNIPISHTAERIYSTDANIFHESHEGGILENPESTVPEDVYEITYSPETASDSPTFITLDFKHGIPVALNEKSYPSVELLEKLNKLGGENGIGRIQRGL